jgi:hypothetical protein
MSSSQRVRALATAATAASLAAILLHGCSEQATAPEISEAVGHNPQLRIETGSSSASGTVTSSPGSINCTITGSLSGATKSGTCADRFSRGTVVTLTATPASGAILKLDQEWQNCIPNVDDRRICMITMNDSITIAATFVPASVAYTLTVSGGAGGSGTVVSTPSGVSCTITTGQASAGNCSAGFVSGTQVKLTATAAAGSYLKAWAGGGCDVAGTGVGSGTGSCTTMITANVNVVVSFDVQTGSATLGQWAPPIDWPAIAIHAVLLPNGKVMTWSRMNRPPVIWDPASGNFTTLSEPADLFCSGLTLLSDGRVFIAGGHSGVDAIGIKTTFLYDPTTNTWFRAPDMQKGRWYPTTTTLANGDVLTVAGTDETAANNLIPEVYQPTSNTWRALTTASRSLPYYPMMFTAPDGRVYYAGPEQSTAFLDLTGTGSWSAGPTRNCCFRDYGGAVMYNVGKILVVGGGDAPTNTAERIDVGVGGSWTNSGVMSVARRQMNATLLADGTVLATGGTNATGFNTFPTSSAVLAAELWSSSNPTVWKKLSSMTHYRLYHSTALLLPDGRVLSAGSGAPPTTGATDDYTAEIFSPPYLFNTDGTPATRPVITSALTEIPYRQVFPGGQSFTIQTPDAASIVKVTLIRLSAVTHSFNENQRMNILGFTAGSGNLTVYGPLNSNMAPPGHYLLFLINGSGVPSVGRIVHLN